MKTTLIRKTALALALSTAATLPAHAEFTAQEVFEAVTSALVQSGLSVDAGSVELDGDDTVIITDLSVGDGLDAAKIPTAELRDVTELQDGVFEIGEVFVPGQTILSPDKIEITYGNISVKELKVATAESGYTELDNGFYTAASVDGVAISEDGTQVISFDAVNVTVTPFETNQPISSSVTVDRIEFDSDTLSDARARETMKALGYEQLRGDLVMNAVWNPKNGQLALTDMTLSAEDAADLTLMLDVRGYTAEIVQAMRDIQADMKPDNEQASGMAMLGMLQQLEFHSMSLTLKDESLTGRVLDFVAAQQGMNRESVTAMALGFLPLGLAQLQSPEFAANAQQAISTYLNDPDTLTVSAKPADPVPFALLMGPALGGNPQALLQMLNVTMSAN
ncbi:MAG: hypothetical protein WA921_03955 [Ahrensia sp.]